MSHWLDNLASALAPDVDIQLHVVPLREVELGVKVIRQGKRFDLSRTISWDELEEARADPLAAAATSILMEWRGYEKEYLHEKKMRVMEWDVRKHGTGPMLGNY